MDKELKDSLNYIFEKEKLHGSQISFNGRRKPDRNKKWIPTFASIGIVVIAMLLFFPFEMDSPSNVNHGSDVPGTKVEESEIFKLKGAYIGDASSVGQISKYGLGDQSTYGNGIQLYTSNEPYGMRIFLLKKMDPTTDVETIFTTASYLFTLIRNIEFVEFEYEDQVYSIYKSDLEMTFGLNYYSYEDEELLRSFISDILSNEQTKNAIYQLIKTTPS
ncbi:DUF4825 domain-containing protein [Ureibacillus manganicus]|uniref:DUF4825 domain-containing protein n=1 Tax=Ureibacillus manganicus DSM 26584 TaxID=1384049 RepID=A0A0A3I3N8_9BACL|nr:DUF4825 domain-containing protein [Ureibacillus manganicus]KGR79319.1 hypothetical protein CD29_06380 [Ureibacillus manganicus DSM 26584]